MLANNSRGLSREMCCKCASLCIPSRPRSLSSYLHLSPSQSLTLFLHIYIYNTTYIYNYTITRTHTCTFTWQSTPTSTFRLTSTAIQNSIEYNREGEKEGKREGGHRGGGGLTRRGARNNCIIIVHVCIMLEQNACRVHQKRLHTTIIFGLGCMHTSL